MNEGPAVFRCSDRAEPGKRLIGTAMVRLSGARWRWPQGRRRPDLLGVALRARGNQEVTFTRPT